MVKVSSTHIKLIWLGFRVLQSQLIIDLCNDKKYVLGSKDFKKDIINKSLKSILLTHNFSILSVPWEF